MKPKLTKQDLIEFENEVAARFNAGIIRAPVHLYWGNEDAMLRLFERVRSEDWVFCSWRSHYQCLLKGVPRDRLIDEIVAGRSISLCFPEYRILSSAIVGGALPIALGVALGIQRSGGAEHVWCFLGEMTAETGIAHECVKYARNRHLPVTWVIEDNGKSVCTDTRSAWGGGVPWWERESADDVIYYRYESKYPHAGAGVRVQF